MKKALLLKIKNNNIIHKKIDNNVLNNNINNINNNISNNKIKFINYDINNNNFINKDILNKNIHIHNDLNKEYLNLLKTHDKKSDILCITSFNNKLYEEYAHKFIDTYCLPFDLIIYAEDDINLSKHNIKYNYTIVNSTHIIPEINEFVQTNIKRNNDDKIKFNKDFLLDGVKFSYKVFAVTHAGMAFTNYKYLIWLDADIIFKKSFNDEFIEKELIRKNDMMSFLGRNNYHSECGFLIFNMQNKYINNYFKEMKRMYTSNDIYKLREYHDSYVWDYVRLQFEILYNVETYSITGYPNINDILTYSILRNYITHLKGKRKYMNKI